jgi:hypothetical protein
VVRMAAPGPLEDEPTAVQLSWLEHEISVKFPTVPGVDS